MSAYDCKLWIAIDYWRLNEFYEWVVSIFNELFFIDFFFLIESKEIFFFLRIFSFVDVYFSEDEYCISHKVPILILRIRLHSQSNDFYVFFLFLPHLSIYPFGIQWDLFVPFDHSHAPKTGFILSVALDIWQTDGELCSSYICFSYLFYIFVYY